MSKWIPCKDRLPPVGQMVLGYDTFYGRIGEAEMAGYSNRLVFPDSDDCNIICWKPLPAPPTPKQIEKWSQE